MKKGNLLIAIAFEGYGIWIITDSLKLGLQTFKDPGPGLFPFLLGILLCLLAIPVMVSDARNLKKHRKEQKPPVHGTRFGKVGAITGAIIGYFLFLEAAGFLVTTFFFLSAMLWIGYPRKWFFSFGFSAIVVAAAYVIFGLLLQIQFPLGLWK